MDKESESKRRSNLPEKNSERDCLLVLGMHRSGTSALTRVISLMGAALPDKPMVASAGNETGHWEPVRLYEYNERLLDELGTHWLDWRPLDFTQLPLSDRRSIQADFIEIIEATYHGAPLFVVKEPRLCRMATLFMEAIREAGVNVVPILIVRNPLEVMASLKAREGAWPDGVSDADVALTWLSHVLESESASRECDRVVVSYEELLSNWQSVRTKLEAQTGVTLPKSLADVAPLIDDFLSNRLRHHEHSTSEVALDPLLRGWVTETYEAISTLAANPASSWAVDVLDRVYSDFQRALPVVDSILSVANSALRREAEATSAASGELGKKEEELREASAQIEEIEKTHRTVSSERDYFQGLSEALESKLAADASEREHFLRCNEALEKLLAEEEGKSDILRRRVDDTDARLEAQSAQLLEMRGQLVEKEVIRLAAQEAAERAEEAEKRARQYEDESNLVRDMLGIERGDNRELPECIAARNAADASERELFLRRNEALEKLLAEEEGRSDILRRRVDDTDARLEAQSAQLLEMRGQLVEKEVIRLAAQEAAERAEEAEKRARQYEDESNLVRDMLGIERGDNRELPECIAARNAADASERELFLRRNEALEKLLAEEEGRSDILRRRVDDTDARLEAQSAQLLEMRGQLVEKEVIRLAAQEAAERAEEAEKRARQYEDESNLVRDMLGIERGDNRELPECIAARNAEIERPKRLVDDLQSRLAASQHLNERARSELRVLQSQQAEDRVVIFRMSAELQATHRAYRDSSSWRITSPLRMLKRVPMATMRAIGLVPGLVRMGGGIISSTGAAVRVTRREGFNGVRRRLDSVESQQNLALLGTDISVSEDDQSPQDAQSFSFEAFDEPEISIIIPVFNQVEYTLKCLRSLSQIDRTYSFEIIVMDDRSSDQTGELIGSIPNVVYVRNQKNLGFLLNCNKGALLARGSYVVFLNNDTELAPDWLTALRRTFDEHGDVGMVGSKLVYPNGELQEAGAIIWEDGSAWNWGKQQDPAHPAYNYVRDVDYVSGASIMIEREFLERLNFFDTRYENAYYEDTDLAMSVRSAGLRVIYQPQSIVTHYEGISSGRDVNEGIKRYQRDNRVRFQEKWSAALKGNLPSATTPYLACDRAANGHVLIVDACTPTPDQDSGSIDMFNMIRIIVNLGYRVHFIPQSNFAHFGHYTEALQKMGVECIYAPFYRNVEEYVRERGDLFSHVILTRIHTAAVSIANVKKYCPSAMRIFYTVDLHFLRAMREAELTDNAEARRDAELVEQEELAMMDEVAVTIVLSDAERKMLESRGKTSIATLPLIRDVPALGPSRYEERDGVLFIGGYQHRPNVDAVDWLATEIWPEVRKLCTSRGLPNIPLHVYGSSMPERFHDYAADDFLVLGFAEDLEGVFAGVRLSVAPLRYGAGLKGKLATSLGYGVPVVGTAIAFEGVDDEAFDPVRAEITDVERLAGAIVSVHENQQQWENLRRAGHGYATNNYSVKVVSGQIDAILSKSQPGHDL